MFPCASVAAVASKVGSVMDVVYGVFEDRHAKQKRCYPVCCIQLSISETCRRWEKWFYTSEIMLAIEYLHRLNIIYRDLKPENILLDAEGHVKLTDFGLSKEGIEDNFSAKSMCGTPEYLAPEILDKRGHGKAVDWYSLGALMYEMLTGLPPFYTRDRDKLFERIRRGDLTYPSYITSIAKNLLQQLLMGVQRPDTSGRSEARAKSFASRRPEELAQRLQGGSESSTHGVWSTSATAMALELCQSILRGTSSQATLLQLLKLPERQLSIVEPSRLCRVVWLLGKQLKKQPGADIHEEPATGKIRPDDIGRKLLLHLRPLLHCTSSKDVGNVAWAYARAHLLDGDFMRILLRSYQDFPPGDAVALANLLWAAALAGVAPESLRAALGKGAALHALDRLQGAELARCLWALGSVRLRHDLFLRAHELSANAKTQDLSNVLWALARVQSSIPAVLLKELEGRRPLAMSELVASTWALAELRLASSAIWPSVTESLELYPRTSRASSSLLRAHAVIMAPPPPALQKLDLQGASPQTLANSLWALAKLQLSFSVDEVEDVLRFLNTQPSAFKPQEFSSCLWAIGSMDNEVAVVAFFEKLQPPNFQCFEDHHLSQVAWAFASAGVGREDVMNPLAEEIVQRQSFGLQALANISWAYASLDMMDVTLATHLLTVTERLLNSATVQDADSLLGLLWAHRSRAEGQATHGESVLAIANRLRQLGMDLDARRSKTQKLQRISEPNRAETDSEPRVVLQVPGVVVLFKPSDWEVDTGGTTHGKALSGFSQMFGLGLGETPGFISRLDTPSSGLVFQATSFESLFVLQAQRELGDLERDYVALCLGWVPGDGEISLRLRKVGQTSVVSSYGRPALSRVKVLAHLSHIGQQVSFIAIRIESGRMHQIRAHLAHLGFPVCGDMRYNPEGAAKFRVGPGRPASGWPSGHCLHRYRVAFNDLAGQRQEVIEPLPRQLCSFLEGLQEHQGGENLKAWLSPSPLQPLQSWEALHRSWVPCEPLPAEKGDPARRRDNIDWRNGASESHQKSAKDPTKRLGGGPK
ncbi:rsks-1, partial [Symbiodinium necroappetens]